MTNGYDCTRQASEEEDAVDAKQQVLDAMRAAGKPVNASTLVQMTGLERVDVDKVMTALKKTGEIESPVRCMWQPKA